MSEHTKTPWWSDTEGHGDQQHNVVCASLGAHGTQIVVDDLNAGYLLDPDERFANAAFIVKAVNAHDALTAENAKLREQLVSVKEYSRDIRRNSSGGDDYPWEIMKSVADELDRITHPDETGK